jgi:hypothetical protein
MAFCLCGLFAVFSTMPAIAAKKPSHTCGPQEAPKARPVLPRSYDEFVALPLDISARRAIFRQLSPSLRCRLVKEHFQRFVKEHPELNEAQRFVLETHIKELTPEEYEAALMKDPAALQRSLEREGRLTAIFNEEQLGELYVLAARPRR